ncbi:MAG: MMPL family transporter [Chthoniobacterales bacterium]
MSSPSRAIAHSIVHRRRAWLISLAVVIVLALTTMALKLRFDTEILNLLPSGFDTVESLKVYSGQFSKNRELTFGLLDETGKVDLEAFAEHFSTMLGKEPWVTRFLDRSPMEKANGMEEVQALALPLLFNLPGDEFDSALAQLQPAAMATRFQQQRQAIESGSPRAEIQLTLDPLGLVIPAMKPLASSFSMEKAQPLVSADGTMHLAMVLTNQPGDGPFECRELMKKVNDFHQRVIRSWDGPAPQIVVTGRTPYVAQMSKGMERDIISTVLGSILLVAAIFYYGFRRVRPLIAIIHVLFLCCILAIALGSLCFPALNGITVGFCSILIGLGVDFGMLLYGAYQNSRELGTTHEEAIGTAIERIGRGILFGAATTGAGFGALLLSGCEGFAQLGLLIMFGILLAAGLMMTVFFLFIGSAHRPVRSDLLTVGLDRYLGSLFRSPQPVGWYCLVLLLGLTIFAVLPIATLKIEPNPQSLEPKNIPAGYALRKIQEKMSPTGDELVLGIIDAPDAKEFHRRWTATEVHWQKLLAGGKIKSVTTPTAFVSSPDNVRINTAKLVGLDFQSIRSSLTQALEKEGFSPEAFARGFRTLDQLQNIAKVGPAALSYQEMLPPNSSWWFVLDKFFGSKKNLACAYLTPLHKISTPAEKAAFLELVTPPGVPVHLTGWTFTLADLITWAQSKLVILTSTMLIFNILLLIFLFHRFRPIFLLMVTITLSIGAMVATVKMAGLPLNLFNILAFPLVLGVGVDYGIYVLLAARQAGDAQTLLKGILKPVLLSALTSIAGFGSLGFAENPSLSGLGLLCAIGVGWSLFATLFFLVPAYVWKRN